MPPESERRPGQGASQSPGEREAPNDTRILDGLRGQLNQVVAANSVSSFPGTRSLGAVPGAER